MQKVEINDLVAHLDSLCASITSAWKTLQVRVNPFCSRVPPSPVDSNLKFCICTQRIKTDQDANATFHTCVGSLLRVLVNFSFLFDANRYPEHRG
jgi:hypothetical protein